jgi:hypothetical protein
MLETAVTCRARDVSLVPIGCSVPEVAGLDGIEDKAVVRRGAHRFMRDGGQAKATEGLREDDTCPRERM